MRIKFSGCQLISPFLGFHESKTATYAKLYHLATVVSAVNRNASAPNTKLTVGSFKDLKTGKWIDNMEH